MSGDARRYAAAVLNQLQQTQLKDSFSCYGTQQSVINGLGRECSLELRKGGTLDSVWSDINAYVENNKKNYILGFIGFDPASQLDKDVCHYQQKIDLFVPETVIECTTSGCRVVKGSLQNKNCEINNISEWQESSEPPSVNIRELDLPELRNRYASSVACFIDVIQQGALERATFARKINTPCNFDLLRTFLSDRSKHEFARSFYFSNENITFAGQSPEVLAEGNTHSFTTHKLSGTYSKDKVDSITDLSFRFKRDQRIISEHQSSIRSIEESLFEMGKVESTKFQIMELPTLLHGWSTFITSPKEQTTIASCLRSVFPYGVNPVEQGFKLLAEHENFCRGPYYGLTGCICPDGEFSFTQVLRSAFIDRESSYLMVGAAITSLSTPELEVEETCSKLRGVQVYEQVNS